MLLISSAILMGALQGQAAQSQVVIRPAEIRLAVDAAQQLHFTEDIPLVDWVPGACEWRVERQLDDQVVDASFYDVNGNAIDIDGDITICSADFEYSVYNLDFRGAVAHESIDGAKAIGAGTAERIFGYYVEGACHVLPEAWKAGKFGWDDIPKLTKSPAWGNSWTPKAMRDLWGA